MWISDVTRSLTRISSVKYYEATIFLKHRNILRNSGFSKMQKSTKRLGNVEDEINLYSFQFIQSYSWKYTNKLHEHTYIIIISCFLRKAFLLFKHLPFIFLRKLCSLIVAIKLIAFYFPFLHILCKFIALATCSIKDGWS